MGKPTWICACQIPGMYTAKQIHVYISNIMHHYYKTDEFEYCFKNHLVVMVTTNLFKLYGFKYNTHRPHI